MVAETRSCRFLVQTGTSQPSSGCLSNIHMKKRKSQGGGSLDKAAKSSKGPQSGRADPDKLAGSPHIALMTDWFLVFLD